MRSSTSFAVWLALLMGSAFPKALSAQQPAAAAPAGTRKIADLEYAKVGDRELLLDIYSPEKVEQPLPLVVWVHGGAWRGGSRKNCPGAKLVAEGYIVSSISYRLSQEAIFPAQIEDCKAAIRFLRGNAEEYHIDPKRIGVMGASAGGHLVALLGTSGEVKELEGEVGDFDNESSRVQAVVDWFGPTDFLLINKQAPANSALDHDSPDSPESKLIGGAVQENKDKAAKASPLSYISADDPPFLIMHGDKDNLVPLGQSEILEAALKKAGVDVKLHVVKGAGHGFGGAEIEDLVRKFFARTLKAEK